jgi:DNA-binding MarR family transcriptional regulator
MTMNRRDRRRHGKRDDGIEIIELTPTHARVLRALMEATEGVKGDTYHETWLARDLGVSVQDVQRYLHDLAAMGFVFEERR